MKMGEVSEVQTISLVRQITSDKASPEIGENLSKS